MGVIEWTRRIVRGVTPMGVKQTPEPCAGPVLVPMDDVARVRQALQHLAAALHGHPVELAHEYKVDPAAWLASRSKPFSGVHKVEYEPIKSTTVRLSGPGRCWTVDPVLIVPLCVDVIVGVTGVENGLTAETATELFRWAVSGQFTIERAVARLRSALKMAYKGQDFEAGVIMAAVLNQPPFNDTGDHQVECYRTWFSDGFPPYARERMEDRLIQGRGLVEA